MTPRRADSASLRDVLSDLASGGDHERAPDLSRSIMGQLGYMRVGARVARRRRMAGWANRAALCLVAAVAFGFGWRVFTASPQVRRPAETTLPQAVGRDVRMQQQRIGGVIQTIRSISSPKVGKPSTSGERPAESKPRVLPEDVNRSAAAPVRWV
jgi:hypothetical protein